MPIRSSTFPAMSGQYLTAHSTSSGPWLWPMTWTFWPVRSAIVRMA